MGDLLGEYQQEVMLRMANPDGGEAPPLAIFGLGIAGEAGEVADLLKKYLGHGERLGLEKLAKELGDVLFYLVAIGLSVGLPLEKVIELNIAKIKARHPTGFSHATAQAKADEKHTEGALFMLYGWERCSHEGIGMPGCPTCDPERERVAERAAYLEKRKAATP